MTEKQKQYLWIDTDLGIDDAVALILATQSEFNILGVSVVYGNVNLKLSTQNALNILYSVGQEDIEIYEGQAHPLIRKPVEATFFHGQNGLGNIEFIHYDKKVIREESFYKIYQKITTADAPVKVVALGPVTNIAILIKAFPDIQNNISELICMGGSGLSGNITPTAEFNFYNDPEAARIVLENAINCTIVPIEATEQTGISLDLQEMYKASANPFLQKIGQIIEFYHNKYHEYQNPPTIHDACAIIYAIKPEFYEVQSAKVEIELDGHCVGKTIIDYKNRLSKSKQTNVVTKVSIDLYWEFFNQLVLNASQKTPYLNREILITSSAVPDLKTNPESLVSIEEDNQNKSKDNEVLSQKENLEKV